MTRVFSVSLAVVAALGALAATGVVARGADNPKVVAGSKESKKGIPPVFKPLTGGLDTVRKPRSLRQQQKAPRVPYIHDSDDLSRMKINTPKGNKGSEFNAIRRKIQDGYNR